MSKSNNKQQLGHYAASVLPDKKAEAAYKNAGLRTHDNWTAIDDWLPRADEFYVYPWSYPEYDPSAWPKTKPAKPNYDDIYRDFLDQLKQPMTNVETATEKNPTRSVRSSRILSVNVIEIDLPGVKPDNCKVETLQVGNNVNLFVEATRSYTARGTVSTQTFKHELLIEDATESEVEVSLHHGMLIIHAPVNTDKSRRKQLQLRGKRDLSEPQAATGVSA